MRRPALPVSVRLALWYALTLAVLLGGFALLSFAGFRASAQRSFDRHLAHEWDAVAPMAGDLDALERSAPLATRVDGPNATFARVLSAGGEVLWQSANFARRPPLAPLPVDGSLSRTWGDAHVRSLARPVGPRRVEVTGYEWTQPDELRGLGWLLAGGVLAGTLFALGVGWWLARRALRPVAVLTDAARHLADGPPDVGARLPSGWRARDELTDLADTLNDLLARLEASVARERRFTANAAHELMNPLAALRSEADVALRREREPQAYREALERVAEDAADLTARVEGLLQLARAEALARTPHSRVDLSELVARRAGRFASTAAARRIALEVDAQPGVRVAAQAPALAQVIDNLIGNAVKYTPPGGSIRVALRHYDGTRHTDWARLEVSDTGLGFDQAVGARLFDRFYRSDAPGVQAEPGSGLGLAVVKAVVEAYGGRVGCASGGPGRGATFWAELPCVGAD